MYLRQAWRSMMEFGPRDQAAAGARSDSPTKNPGPQPSYVAAGGLLLVVLMFQWTLPTLSCDLPWGSA